MNQLSWTSRCWCSRRLCTTSATLIGGETAEMPGMYGEDDPDLAGVARCCRKISNHRRFKSSCSDVDLLDLLQAVSTSNGYSLVRRDFADYTGEEVLPELEGKKLKEVLLEPTRISMSKTVLPLIKEELVNGIAHQVVVSSKMYRMFSDDLAAEIDERKFQFFQFFKALEKYGQIKHEEMFEIFNMRIGLMLAGETRKCERVKELLDEPVYEIGREAKKRCTKCGDKIMAKNVAVFCLWQRAQTFQVIAEQLRSRICLSRSPGCLCPWTRRKSRVLSYAFELKEFENKTMAKRSHRRRALRWWAPVDLVCLAGYMKIVGPTLLAAYEDYYHQSFLTFLPEFPRRSWYWGCLGMRAWTSLAWLFAGWILALIPEGHQTSPLCYGI